MPPRATCMRVTDNNPVIFITVMGGGKLINQLIHGDLKNKGKEGKGFFFLLRVEYISLTLKVC